MRLFRWGRKGRQIDLDNKHFIHGGPADLDKQQGAQFLGPPIHAEHTPEGGLGQEHQFGDRLPPANFNDHTNVLGTPPGQIASQEHKDQLAAGALSSNGGNQDSRFVGPPIKEPQLGKDNRPPHWVGPPIHKDDPTDPRYLGPPIHKDPTIIERSDNGASSGQGYKIHAVSSGLADVAAGASMPNKSFSQPPVSLGGEGIVVGGVSNPLEPQHDNLKPWGGHELTDNPMGLNPTPPGKNQS